MLIEGTIIHLPGAHLPGEPRPGTYISTELRWLPAVSMPPATRTEPSLSSVAVCWPRGVLIDATVVHVWVLGLYSSTLSRALDAPSKPPVTRTQSSCLSCVAVWSLRAVFIGATVVHVWAL